MLYRHKNKVHHMLKLIANSCCWGELHFSRATEIWLHKRLKQQPPSFTHWKEQGQGKGATELWKGPHLLFLPLPSLPVCLCSYWVQTGTHPQESAGSFPLSSQWQKKRYRETQQPGANIKRTQASLPAACPGSRSTLFMMWFRKRQWG